MEFKAACGHILSPEREDLSPCPACDCCQACCACEPDMGDAVDHTAGVLGDLDEQVRELS